MSYGKRFLWFTEDGKEPVRTELHDTDAIHALDTDPEHWSVEEPGSAPMEAPVETDEEIMKRLEAEEAERKAKDEQGDGQ
jgi:hypothetical protein